MKNEIEILRKEVDQIDNQIVALLVKRLGVVKKIGDWKIENGKWKVDRKREMEVLENVKKHAPKELYSSIETIYKTIIKVSKKIQI